MGSTDRKVSAEMKDERPGRLPPMPVHMVRFVKAIDLPYGGSSSGWQYGKQEGTDCHYLPYMRHFEFTYQRPGTDPQNDDMPYPVQRRFVWEGLVERWDPR